MDKKDIDAIIKNAKKLAKTKTENELFEKIGKEVSKAKFHDKFKPGDIICSDRFHNGLCMVVESCEETQLQYVTEFRYKCKDFIREEQGWAAYQSDTFDKPYNWRIATDDDIANYLSRFLHTPLGKIGAYDVELTDDGIRLDDGGEYGIYFTAEELVQLGKIINERVVG